MLQTFLEKYNTLVHSLKHEEMPLMHTYFLSMPFATVTLYLLMVFQLPKVLTALKIKFDNLKWIMFFWNVFLSVGSFIMLIGTAVPYISHVSRIGISNYICDENNLRFPPGPELFWAYVFVLSKFAELIDTLLLILKNPERPVPFLHWFHHTTVLLFCWYGLYYRYSAGSTFMCMNAFIHTLMYLYYGLTDLGYKPSWSIVLTVGQILQMVLGIVTNSYWAYMYYKQGRDCNCDNPEVILTSCVLMYGAYLYLFCSFFYRRYITGELAKKAK